MRSSLLAAVAAALVLVGCPNNAPGFCGDGLCRPSESESSISCAIDCMAASCGDGTCAPGNGESCANCPSDCGGCGPQCGDGACAISESCSSCPGDCGMCATTCGPTNCAGCCSGNRCFDGTAPSTCGSGGNACLDCGAAELLCQDSTCAFDPASRWNVLIDSYELNTSYTGDAWDFPGGFPDPVVTVFSPNSTSRIGAVNGPDGVFDTTFTIPELAAANIRADALLTYVAFLMEDEDPTDYEFVGSCVATSYTQAFAGIPVTTTCARNPATGNSGFSVRWHLEPF